MKRSDEVRDLENKEGIECHRRSSTEAEVVLRGTRQVQGQV